MRLRGCPTGCAGMTAVACPIHGAGMQGGPGVPRIRSIKPEFFDDYEFVSALPRDLRLYYVALWVRCCDDRGCFPDVAPWVAKETFPYDADITPAVIDEWNKRLIELGRLVPYEVGGKRYLCVRHFLDHQKIDRPSKTTVYPIPSEWQFDEKAWGWVTKPGTLAENANTDRGPNSEPSHDEQEGLDEDSTSAQRALALGSGSGSGSGVGVGGGSGEAAAAQTDATERERAILGVLKSVNGYPFRWHDDLNFIRTLAADYPTVDLLKEAQKWATAKLDKPLKARSNPRLQFRNWCENAIRFERERRQYPARASPSSAVAPAVMPYEKWCRIFVTNASREYTEAELRRLYEQHRREVAQRGVS